MVLPYRLRSIGILLCFLVVALPASSQEKVILGNSLIKPSSSEIFNLSGDSQFQIVNEKFAHPIRVRVLDSSGLPVAGYPVIFTVLSAPSGSQGEILEYKETLSDGSGMAFTDVMAGSKPGQIQVSARIVGEFGEDLQIFNLYARKSNWIFFMIIGLVGGIGIFLFGLNRMSEGLQQTAGNKLRAILSSVTQKKIVAVGVGAFITMIIQSSSATTVMLVSFVEAGLINFRQTLGIILGADIGTTITAQLIALKLTDYALLFIGVGFILEFFVKNQKLKLIGKTLLGFGLLFFGMEIMSTSMAPLRSYEPFIQLLIKLENPLFGILIGTIFTSLLQSSSAFIGITIVLASQGLLSLEASIPLLLGANLGTAITAIIASINTHVEAKRVALAHTLFKVLGVVAIVGWIPAFAQLVEWLSPKGDQSLDTLGLMAQVVPRQIANAHTIFNIGLTVIAFPFTNLLGGLVEKIIPGKPEEEPILRLKHIKQGMYSSPTLSLNLAKQEVLRMIHIVQGMVDEILLVFITKEEVLIEEILQKEEKVNFLRNEISLYLNKIIRDEVSEKIISESFQMMYSVKEFEQMADIVSNSLVPKARQWLSVKHEFSMLGKMEIIAYHEKTQKQLSRAYHIFKSVNLQEIKVIKKKYKEYKKMAIELERQHYLRLRGNVKDSVASSEYHLELIGFMQAIIRHSTNIAKILIQWDAGSSDDKK